MELLTDININGINGIDGINGMAVLVSPLTVTLAQAIPERGLIINQLVMLPDADFAINGVIIPTDSVVDVVQAVVWPPGSVRTLPGIAEDLRVISSREIYMYFPQAVTLTNRGEFQWSFPENIPSPTVGLIAHSRVSTVTVSYALYPNVNLTVASGGSTEHEGILANDNIALPAGTFVIIAPGSTLDFLSYNRHTVGADADSVDYATLPPNATAVLPAGSETTVLSIRIDMIISTVTVAGIETTLTMSIPSSTVAVAIVGPAHIRMGGSDGNGLALVNHASLMETSPVIYYEGDTYAFDGEQIEGAIPSSVQPNFSTKIPAGTRGDIFGHTTRRDGFDFAVNMLPSDTREFLRNFPMIYAVAPRCRAEIAEGEDCASDDNGGGLEFALEEGEEILLEEDLIAGGNMRIMPFSPSAEGLQLTVKVWELIDYVHNQNEQDEAQVGATLNIISPQTFMAVSLAIDEGTGMVALYPLPVPGGSAISTTFDNSEVMEIAAAANSPDNTVVRVYMNIDSAGANLTAGNYVDLAGVTVYAGGYTQGQGMHEVAAGRVTLNVAAAIARSATLSVGFLSGYGAKIVGARNGQPIFGVDSKIDLALSGQRAQLRLDDYVPVDFSKYRMTLYPASNYARVNARGNIDYQAKVGEPLVITERLGELFTYSNIYSDVRQMPFVVDMTRSSIAMEPGYLWQGYLNSRGGEIDVTLQVAAQPLLESNSLAPEAYVRIQPVAEELNFWGTGRERPEGMDNRSISRQDESNANNYIVTGNNVGIVNFLRTGIVNGDNVILNNNRIAIGSRPFGYTSPISGGASSIGVRARVYNMDGSVRQNNVTLQWTTREGICESIVRYTGARTEIRWSSETGSRVEEFDNDYCAREAIIASADRIEVPGALAWGYNNSPFNVDDQSFIDNNEDVWALRRIASLQNESPTGKSSRVTPSGGNALLRLSLGGETAVADFNPPAFQMLATRVAQPRGWVYQSKGANLPLPNENFYLDATPRVSIPKCFGAGPSRSPTPERTPGALLGSPADVERTIIGSGNLCGGSDNRIFSFSSRVRRDSAPATYEYDNLIRDRQFLPSVVSNTPELGRFGIIVKVAQFGSANPRVIFNGPITVEVRGSERAPLPNLPAAGNPASYTIPGNYKAGTLAISVDRQTSETTKALSTISINVPLVGDLVFYMERAYNTPTQTPGGLGAIPQQYLRFGDDFSISGPAALVPHFGGRNMLAVADVYGERSRLMSGLFGREFALHDKYSAADYDCGADEVATPGNCPQMMNPDNARFWVPIVSGVVAYEAAEVKITGADRQNMEAVVVLPQPQAEVIDAATGNAVTIYGGSIIHPYSGLVQPSVPISVRSRLLIFGEAVAAVDVSPVNLPTPIRFLRNKAALQAWDFNYTPVRMNIDGDDVLVEPLNFEQNDIIDFSIVRSGASAIERDANNQRVASVYRVESAAYRIDNGGVTATIRYDGTRARGFLMNERMSDIMEAYYTGQPVFVPAHGFTTYFPQRDGEGQEGDLFNPLVQNPLQPGILPEGNQVAHVGNPLSWHWLQRRGEGSFIPLGASRQFFTHRLDRYNNVPASDSSLLSLADPDSLNECGSDSLLSSLSLLTAGGGIFETARANVRPVRYPDFPIAGFPGLLTANDQTAGNQYTVVPCAGSRSHYWVGVRATSSSSSYADDDDEFTALRLLHRIEFPDDYSGIVLEPNSSRPVYPSSKDKFFQFPPGSFANVLQTDAASWESVHPYVSRYLPGAVIANNGGIANNVDTERMLVTDNNDGHRRIDISGRRVLHYARTESAPGDYAHSNAPVYTNVWIRLLRGGILEPIGGGEIVNLPANTVINPILGVYLVGASIAAPVKELESNYAAFGEITNTLVVVRPALIIPQGAILRVGRGGGKITNVKAAAIFSLTPLDGIGCPYGGIDGDGVALNEGLQSTVTISQSREGVDERAYDTAIGSAAGTTTFTLGHPCAWADDPENTDGDRFFIYRSRRRYEQQHKVRVISDDRTYLLGGKLSLGRV